MTDSKLFRIVCVSLWPLTIFFIIPLLVILHFTLDIRLPFALSKQSLLFNNLCFALLIAIRFICYFSGLSRRIRYGVTRGKPAKFEEIATPASTARSSLASAGFFFDSTGNYAEKRDSGYLGVVLLYGGLFVVLSVGTLDNMRQFSGSLLDGIGASTDLTRVEAYSQLSAGPLTGKPTQLPKMKIIRQFAPDATYPRGAAQIAFVAADGKEKLVILKASDIFKAGPYDIFISKMVYEPKIVITINDTSPVFKGQIKLYQLAKKENGFGFYGTFIEGFIEGKVYYQPEKSRLRVVLNQGEQVLLDTELLFQVERLSRSANFSIMCDRMGVWSEIHVVRRRHMPWIFLGGFLAAIGLLMRIIIKPQRVWLEETYGGNRVRIRTVGGEAARVRTGVRT